MSKVKKSTAIIGGADGPTSVFIAGKMDNKLNIKQKFQKRYGQYRRKKAEKMIVADAHTLDETIFYMKNTYKMKEVSNRSRQSIEQRKCLRESLIMQHKPELLGEWAELDAPKDLNEEDLKKFWKLCEMRSQKASEILEKDFPLDYHVYKLRTKRGGELSIDIEKNWDIISSSYSGNKREMRAFSKIMKDIYWYYGVTKKDIEERTERYMTLVCVLSS